jgi:hypothetical protein
MAADIGRDMDIAHVAVALHQLHGGEDRAFGAAGAEAGRALRQFGADQVADLLQTRSRQTPHDRAKAGTLLAIRENGRLRFPLCQFDPEGPDGVVPGLAAVLTALDFSPLAKAAWLERPHPALDGQTPIERLRTGDLAGPVAIARCAGHGQD